MPKNKRATASDLRKIDAHKIRPEEYEDAPEWTDQQLASAVHEVGGKPVGRPRSESPKVPVTVRLDADLVKSYRDRGSGWQTRMNADLRRVRKLKRNA